MDTSVARMTGLEWDHLVEAGTLDGPFELVGGRKVRRMTINPPHAATVRVLSRALWKVCPSGSELSLGHPIELGVIDRPEPDIAVIESRPSGYPDRHPRPLETSLVIEVSLASLVTDLGEKADRYAYAGIEEYWVVDVEAQVVVVHLDPVPEQGIWGSVTRIPYGKPIQARALDGPVTLPSVG